MKEQVTKFNLEAAFKALNEIEIPQVGGVKPNKTDHKELRESMRPTPKTDCLLEDYYDVSNNEDLEVAAADRAEEVAQAKLAKIEKIVDLDAESPEDLQPSYVGKTIVQCPQCMTLFYRDPADINVSEEDKTIANVGEVCPNCGNDSGYQLIGKVGEVEAEEQTDFNAEVPAEENELDLNFEEPVEENGEEVSAEENKEEELNLEPVEEPTEENKEEEKPEEEEEKKEESFEPHSENILAEQVENALKEEEVNKAKLSPKDCIDIDKYVAELTRTKTDNEKIELIKKIVPAIVEYGEKLAQATQDPFDTFDIDMITHELVRQGIIDEKDAHEYTFATEIREAAGLLGEALKEAINADELTKKLKEHDEYIKVLQDEIKAEEEAVKNAKNDFIKKMHENNLASLKDALDKAIPEEVKAEAAIEELPTAEDAAEDMTKNEAVEEAKKVEVKEIKEEKCPVCGDELDGKEPCEKCKKELENKEELKESLEEEKCEICGKDVEEPCKSEEETKECENKLEEDVIAKEAPEKADDIELEQRKVSEIHKGKVEHVPGAVVDEALTEADIPEEAEDIKDEDPIEDEVEEEPTEEEVKVELTSDEVATVVQETAAEVADMVQDIVEPTEEQEEEIAEKVDEIVVNKVEEVCPDCEVVVEKEEDLPEEEIKDAVEGDPVEESCENCNKELKESSVEDELNQFAANLGEGCENCNEKELKEDSDVARKIADFENEITDESLQEAGEKCDIGLMKEINEPMSFKELINSPTFKKFGESVEDENLQEELPTAVSAAGQHCLDALDRLESKFSVQEEQLEPELEELNDKYINEAVSNYLTEVYSNVDKFTATNCSLTDNKLVIEGIIDFKSGKNKSTKFEFSQVSPTIYEGYNKDLAGDSKFTLNCFKEDGGTMLMAESLAYSYKIGENLIEGIAKTNKD